VLRAQGPERAHFLLEKLVDFTRRSGTYLPFKPNTAYLNTISKAQEPEYPGDRSLERRNEAYYTLECTRHGGAGQPGEFRVRRPYRQLRLRGHVVRGGVQSLLARQERRRIPAT
jgi:hypothetical protein